MKLDLSQLSQSGAVVGDRPVWDGTEWVPGEASSGTPLFADDDMSPLVADDVSDYLYADS